jgi:hypothetical protein
MTDEIKPPKLFVIPAGTRPSKCPCDAVIYWVKRQPLRAVAQCHYLDKGKIISMPDALAPTITTDGMGFSHFLDCPKRQQFRS